MGCTRVKENNASLRKSASTTEYYRWKGEKDARLAIVTLEDYELELTGYKAKGDLWDGELHPCWHVNSSKHTLHRSQPTAWR